MGGSERGVCFGIPLETGAVYQQLSRKVQLFLSHFEQAGGQGILAKLKVQATDLLVLVLSSLFSSYPCLILCLVLVPALAFVINYLYVSFNDGFRNGTLC